MSYQVNFISNGKTIRSATVEANGSRHAMQVAANALYGKRCVFSADMGMDRGDDYAYGQIMRGVGHTGQMTSVTGRMRCDVSETQ